jgi:hypothetical protein
MTKVAGVGPIFCLNFVIFAALLFNVVITPVELCIATSSLPATTQTVSSSAAAAAATAAATTTATISTSTVRYSVPFSMFNELCEVETAKFFTRTSLSRPEQKESDKIRQALLVSKSRTLELAHLVLSCQIQCRKRRAPKPPTVKR